MIAKTYELKNKFDVNINHYLLYGSNTGLMNDLINNTLMPIFSENLYKYDENEILSNEIHFMEAITNKSFFEEDKLIIIDKATDKILNIVEEIIKKKIENVKFILKANVLDKKSKLRNFFEKSKLTLIVPFYDDNFQTLLILTQNFFKKKKIKISNQIVNFIIKKSKNNRAALNNELGKIESYSLTNKIIDFDKIKILINLSDDWDMSELVDQYLTKNKTNTIEIVNENSLTDDKCIVFTRVFLAKLKRLKKLKLSLEKEKNLEQILLKYKPPIFWKEKETIKIQLKKLSLKEINFFIKEANNLELTVKKNPKISNQLLNNFVLKDFDKISNAI